MKISICIFYFFFFFLTIFSFGQWKVSAAVQQINSFGLPAHQMLSQVFTWQSNFYVGTKTIGLTLPYNATCTLWRFNSKGTNTGSLDLIHVTGSRSFQSTCEILTYACSSNSTVTLVISSDSFNTLVEIDLPTFSIVALGQSFIAAYPTLIAIESQSNLIAYTKAYSASLYKLAFPGNPLPSSQPILQFPLQAVYTAASASSTYFIGVGTTDILSHKGSAQVLFNQSLASGNYSTMSGVSPRAVITHDGTIVSTTEVAGPSGSTFTTYINIFPSSQPFPTTFGPMILAKDSLDKTAGILASNTDIFVFMSSGGPSYLAHFTRSSSHPSSYDFAGGQNIGAASLGYDMLSGGLLSTARTFACASYMTPSDFSQISFYSY